jgi:glutamate synthase (NADPH/NADH) small chain
MTAFQANVEADRCLRCAAPAPCMAACPGELEVPRFLDAVAQGGWEEAAQVMFAENLLAATCALLCPAGELCQSACVLTREGGRPVAIRALERFVANLALDNPWARFRVSAPPSRRRIGVIGSGPAGLACAGELAVLGHAVRVYEATGEFGGLLRYGIAARPLEPSHLAEEVRAIMALGVELYLDSPIDTLEQLWEIERHYDAIFLGIGPGDDGDCAVPGDNLPGVFRAREFLEQARQGMPIAPGSRVVVVGGGNTALEVARAAQRQGAAQVSVLYRRAEPDMPAYREALDRARAESIRIHFLTQPVEFLGTTRLTGVRCEWTRLETWDDVDQRLPVSVPGSGFKLAADLAVTAVGLRPPLTFLRWIEGLDLDRGRPRINPVTGQTTNPKYFAGGALVAGGGSVGAAVRAGRRAARGIDRWLAPLMECGVRAHQAPQPAWGT